MRQTYNYNGILLSRMEHGFNSAPVNYDAMNDEVQRWIDESANSFFVNQKTGQIYEFATKHPLPSTLIYTYTNTVDFINQAYFDNFINDLLTDNEDIDYEDAYNLAVKKFYN